MTNSSLSPTLEEQLVFALQIAARPVLLKFAEERDYDTDLERMVPKWPDAKRRLLCVDKALARAAEERIRVGK